MRSLDRLLVVAPHPDDDAIGCGGTIARSAGRGATVSVVYVTDGAASHPNSKRYPPEALRALREREAIEGLRRLGIATPPVFLRVPDGRVSHLSGRERDLAIAALEACIDESACEVVFGPWRDEPHPDHAGTAALLAEALARRSPSPVALSYAVWLEVDGTPSNRPGAGWAHLDVHLTAEELACKREAIMAHASQVSPLIDDDPEGFRVLPEVLDLWLQPVERFYVDPSVAAERVSTALHLGTTIR
jgi:LmbE family N-acetylglucosaminyl deacetylase